MVEQIINELAACGDPERAAHQCRFFKTGPGEYGEGDSFLGVEMPKQRALVKRYAGQVSLDDLEQLITRPYHECRMTALLLTVELFQKSRNDEARRAYVSFYLDHLDQINNWDLVDVTCYKILGPWLLERDRVILYRLAESADLWRQRIAVVTTYCFIKHGQYRDTLDIADLLLHHEHDLIHKAVGWMLREVGNRAPEVEREFLRDRYTHMPRTMLRYAIEKFPETERRAYLHGLI